MKLLLLDLDGTIRRSKSGSEFITDPSDQEPIKKPVEVLISAEKQGWIMVGLLNSSVCGLLSILIKEKYESIQFNLS